MDSVTTNMADFRGNNKFTTLRLILYYNNTADYKLFRPHNLSLIAKETNKKKNNKLDESFDVLHRVLQKITASEL